ncbi:hypothetical protein A2422_04430 [Candidatus Woesebacteria bacterium RIFOXYC1_FULL_31_51]|uniref:TrpR-related protein YerC/YecD n=1 Tax=Candidatus Woesebacteria bacterium GW2011_GWC2_31_9 TaxID=1618586 RepID=A0A0F9YI21_9BACT|nr:MAG: TrpR-related protein YerC/YecD [Candidatus Woesebacteria bacterium GW2011_GWF1_31_35]KKP23253.1 MAG: TrpR-related protein YerC/YecD [Candidatus Woesebacteria bacterium GW2011_GWC1_30_29]KKP25495.1 MAG: TrpR-related protein YerC/YecD [Candidatus Woesebacteria bacterium GW2011_GWD1_31_12]KKP27515.1 MAG: TrpR-related protein YerC/YecD [Candidatus Woesebacteria bacterium GW2011_GWB1_31_29]KKP30902.1 MAG: TrpR-related protein YerC/YecD [Candidatus Woesebacteria bacterium GW2011_GWE2_31_6]KK
MRVSKKALNPYLQKEIINTFFQTISDLSNPEEIKIFLTDFLNDAELETFSKRLAIAYYLKKGRSYSNIKDNLKVSSATVAVIEKLLDTNGFKLALKKMEAEEWANQWAEKIKNIVK